MLHGVKEKCLVGGDQRDALLGGVDAEHVTLDFLVPFGTEFVDRVAKREGGDARFWLGAALRCRARALLYKEGEAILGVKDLRRGIGRHLNIQLRLTVFHKRDIHADGIGLFFAPV